MPELRILSGYHRGATLPLDGEALSIGGDDGADVVLADPGLALQHARLRLQDGVWMLEPVDGAVRGAHDNAERDQVALGDGGFARVGPIWVTVCAAGQDWQDPPPEPADVAPGAPGASEALDAPLTHEAPEPAAPVAAAVTQDDSAPPSSAPNGRGARVVRLILAPLAAMAALSGAAAYALTPRSDDVIEALAAREAAALERMPAAPQALAPAQLRAALRQRLREIDLLARVTLDLEGRKWTISGALNEEDGERLQRMLRDFARRYVLDFPVNVRIGSAESMLPFRISQVISGDDPCIITDDGRRLYVGEEYRGVRLAAVAGSQLRFTGKQTLEIAW